MPKGIHKKATVDYWKDLGVEDLLIPTKIEEYKNSTKRYFPLSIEFWRKKGYDEIECIEKLNEVKLNLSKSRIKSKDKWMKTLNPPTGERNHCSISYWMKKGFTEIEAKDILRQQGRDRSPRAIEYWMKKGFEIENAKELLSAHQSRNEEYFIKKYGMKEGKERILKFKEKTTKHFKNRKEYWLELGYSIEESKNIVSDIQKDIAVKNPTSITKYLNLGYSIEDSKKMVFDILSSRFVNIVEYWKDSGLDENEIKNKISKIQKERCKKRKKVRSSKLENFIFKSLSEICDNIIHQYSITFNENKKVFIDFVIMNNIAIEIFGDFWHANPNYFFPTDKIFLTHTAEDIWKKDFERLNVISSEFPISIIIWENEIISNKHRIVNFLKEKIYETEK